LVKEGGSELWTLEKRDSTFIPATGEIGFCIHLFKNTEGLLRCGMKRSNGNLYKLVQKGVPFAIKKGKRGSSIHRRIRMFWAYRIRV
jgi:hypothetical protein